MGKGMVGAGVSSGAKVAVRDVQLQPLPVGIIIGKKRFPPHQPNFAVRKWLGGRPWVFDGDEPILLLPVPEANGINNVKLRPGYKPQLSWNSHWDIQNQGAFPEGTNKHGPTTTEGGGKTLTAKWTARQTQDRFETRTTLTIGWDEQRRVYRYDIDSELEVLPGEPFHFRYGYDFEHHTPLDPFNWQYLVVRREGDQLRHRPVYPVDPGQMDRVEPYQGLRMWYGRHHQQAPVAPAVEYLIDPEWNRDASDPTKLKTRKLNTAVCAAFYDTGVSFEPETAKPGTKVRVKYRYTGYPADEAKRIFEASQIHESFMLDPQHYYIFADEWPTLTFSQHVPMSKTWIYGRTPFMTGHNQRPTYELMQFGEEYAMKLGPASFGAARLPLRDSLKKGRYVLSARVHGDCVLGPGARMELTVTEPKTGKSLASHKHFTGTGAFLWKTTGFAFDVPQDGCGLTLGFGNAGIGYAYFKLVNFRRLEEENAVLPEGVTASANSKPAPFPPAPAGAIADYRMDGGLGRRVFDYANGPFGMLELANVSLSSSDFGHPALKFADNLTGSKDYPRAGTLDRGYFSYPGYKERQTVPVALAGHHGGGMPLKAFTFSTWVKPAAQMGSSTHGGLGDVLGVGARRFILSLYGQNAPYRLGARLNVEDVFIAKQSKLDAERWYHVAMTGEPTPTGKWQVRLYLDGQLVHEGESKKFAAPATIPPSVVFGTEIFYFHDAYYRGLIGRTLIFDRALAQADIAELAKP